MTWLLLAILIACSGAISGSETALFGLTRHELRSFENSSHRLERLAASLMAESRATLLTLLIANTAVNVAIFAVSFITADSVSDNNPVIAGLLGLGALVAVILFGEVLPKTFALSNAVFFAPIAAVPTRALLIVLRPVRWFFSIFLVIPATRLLTPSRAQAIEMSTDDLRDLVDGSTGQDVISTTESDMLQAVVGLSDVSVKHVMTPRVDVHAMMIDDPSDEIIGKFSELETDRLLVFGKDLDDIRGLLYARDYYVQPDSSIDEILRPVGFVPELSNLMQVIQHFRETGIAMAIVVDEYGGMEGQVTMADVMEVIVGDLPGDPYDDGTIPAMKIDDNTYRLSGSLSMSEWRQLFGLPAGDGSVVTLGGLVTAQLGRVPRVGDRIATGNLVLEVEEVLHHRVQSLMVQRHETQTDRKEGDS